MYQHILVPIDLGETPALEKALATAADLSLHWGARLTYLGVTPSEPTKLAPTPEAFDDKLEAFAAEDAARRGVRVEAVTVETGSLRTDLNRDILEMVDELDIDLVVMGTHMPGLLDYVIAGRAAHVAAHAKVTVMVVR